MLKLSGTRHNHHSSGVKMLAKFIQRGIWVLLYQRGEHHEALSLLCGENPG
jgi:hypothetical protein